MPRLSFIISTFNRREVLLGTLARLRECEIEHEVFVIDNASGDGTADAVRQKFPEVRLISLNENRGSCAKNLALPLARGEYVVFLDDDSFPQPGAIARMIEHFEELPMLGAAGFTVTLPDGSRECSAYPDVFIGCGVGFRRAVLEQVGGLPEDFFMQAEEYDLSLRLLDAGWDVRTFDDLHVTHLKTPGARVSERTMLLDVRNNLVLVARYFPQEWGWPYSRDWMLRYGIIAASKGYQNAFEQGLAEASAKRTAGVGRREVSAKTFERFAKIDQTRQRMAKYDFRRVLFADYGKNMLAYRLAAEACDMQIVAIADTNLGGRRFTCHGIPIVDDQEAQQLEFDAIIVSNLSPVHARRAAECWRKRTDKPVIDLFE
ncbi:MAG TPA: glycosyltransferase family 2 protein [Tepidisphaeraceae bacterium]|jgi:GT2 family glycosyltransferase